MSMTLSKLSGFRPSFRWPSLTSRFNGVGAAGPRRLAVIAAVGTVTAGLLVGATFIHGAPPPAPSRPGRLPPSDPTPGGSIGHPYSEALAQRSNQEAATAALKAGQSYTPQINASRDYAEPKPSRALLTSAAEPPKREPFPAPATAAPAPSVASTPAVTPTVTPASGVIRAVAGGTDRLQARTVQANAGTAEDPRYKAAIDRLLNGWAARPPQTQVVLPPEPGEAQDGVAGRGGGRSAGTDTAATPVAASVGGAGRQRVLIPAGRGVRGHTVMGANSDVPGTPVVVEADTGPIARQRLIGSWTKQDDYLVIKLDRMSFNGREVPVDGILVAPDSVEAAVASSVDHNYGSRYLLPAAAAFVNGLGQALALSNSTVVASPFGGATALQRLNLGQQLGIGAGVAAGRVGQSLDQAAPKGSTVKVDRGASVSIMFLKDVVVPN